MMAFLDLTGLARFKSKIDTLLAGKLNTTLKGVANGLAELDANGKVPSSQLPSFVDDILEFDAINFSAWDEWVAGESYVIGDKVKVTTTEDNSTSVVGYICIKANSSLSIEEDEWTTASKFPLQGEEGKIYVAKDTNRTYRWAGTSYVGIASDLALGETSSSAYRGDHGKTAYDHATDSNRLTTAQASGLYKIAVTSEGHVQDVTAVQKSDITSLGIPGSQPDLSGKLDVDQGLANAGKYMKVGNDGTLYPESVGADIAVFDDSTFSIATTDWNGVQAPFTATKSFSSIKNNTAIWIFFDESYYTYASAAISSEKGTGSVTFSTSVKPTGTITGTLRAVNAVPVDAAVEIILDGKLDVNQGSNNAGKYMKVGNDGNLAPATVDVLPSVTSSDDGKVLKVVNGSWEAATSQASSVSVEITDETQTSLDIADANGYVVARFNNGHIQTKNFDSSTSFTGFEWKISGTDLLISYGYTSTVDAVVVLNRGRANNLFDFSAFKTKPKGTPLSSLETADLTSVWASGTDMHAPFQFNAVNNADGYNASATTPGFVGGNHTLDQLGTGFETAESKYVYYFADGHPVTSGSGRASKFEIRWANDVQAYNTVKQGGGGRTCLTEYHDMIFDGVQFNETVKLVALEDIDIRLWYGFQFVNWGSTFTNLRFIDATNTGIYTSGDVNCGSLAVSGMETYGTAHKLIMTIDEYKDLGKRSFAVSSTQGAFTSGTKGYFRIMYLSSQNTWTANTAHYLYGSWRFMPVVEEE